MSETGVPIGLNITPLDAELVSRFPSTTSMNIVMDNMLLERWIINMSYEHFSACMVV
jgi:hypothetical protein